MGVIQSGCPCSLWAIAEYHQTSLFFLLLSFDHDSLGPVPDLWSALIQVSLRIMWALGGAYFHTSCDSSAMFQGKLIELVF